MANTEAPHVPPLGTTLRNRTVNATSAGPRPARGSSSPCLRESSYLREVVVRSQPHKFKDRDIARVVRQAGAPGRRRKQCEHRAAQRCADYRRQHAGGRT